MSPLVAHLVISLRGGTWSPSVHSGLCRAVRRGSYGLGLTLQQTDVRPFLCEPHRGTSALYGQGKPMIEHVNNAIERTHRITGMPREEIVRRGLARSEIPLYALGAGLLAPGVMGALACMDNEN